MKKPWVRESSQSWVVTLPGGKLKTLGKYLPGTSKTNPPKDIEEAWHTLDRRQVPKDMLFADVAALYLAYLKNPGSRKSSKEHLDRFTTHVGAKIKVSDLRVHHVNDYLNARKTWADSTKATAVNRITSALNWAHGEGYIEEHKVKFAKGKKPRYARRKADLTADQQTRLEAASHPALRKMLIALRESGCRPGEMCRARIEKVDLKGRVMLVPNKVAGKTGEVERTVYLSPALIDLVRGSIGDRKEGFVFLNSRGKPWHPPSISCRVRKLRIKLKMPEGVVPYAYRGKYASDAINNADANPAVVAKLLGHSDLEMLMRHYYKENPEAMHRAIEKITGQKPAEGK